MQNKPISKVGRIGVRGLFHCVLACSSLVLPGLAMSATCASGNAAQQISCLKMENAVLGERLAHVKLMKNIAKQSNTTGESRKLGFPSVMSTYGVGDNMSAVLVWMRNGKNAGSMVTQVGSSIPDGWHVQKIAGGTVVVQKGAQVRTLLLSSGSASSDQISLHGNSGPIANAQLLPSTSLLRTNGAISGPAGTGVTRVP